MEQFSSHLAGSYSANKSITQTKREPHTLTSYSSLQEQKVKPQQADCFIDQQGSSQSLGDVSGKAVSKKPHKITRPQEAPFVIKEDLTNEIDSPLGKFNTRRVYEDLLDDEMSQSIDGSQDCDSKKDYGFESGYDFTGSQAVNNDQIVDSYLHQFNYEGAQSFPRYKGLAPDFDLDNHQAESYNTPGNVNSSFGQEYYSKATSKSEANPYSERDFRSPQF